MMICWSWQRLIKFSEGRSKANSGGVREKPDPGLQEAQPAEFEPHINRFRRIQYTFTVRIAHTRCTMFPKDMDWYLSDYFEERGCFHCREPKHMLVAQRPDISLSWNVWDSFSVCGSKAMQRFLFLHHLWTICHPEEEDYNKFYRALAHNQHKLQTWHKCWWNLLKIHINCWHQRVIWGK